MIVTFIKTGKTEKVNASYGARLIEQGKAFAVRVPKKTAKKETAKAASDA